MKNTPIQVAGMAWYLAEDFSEIKTLMEDGHKLHSSHAGWQAAAEKGEQSLRAQGVRVYRAVVRPAAFKAWCDARGLKLNADARNEFAAGFAKDEYRAGR